MISDEVFDIAYNLLRSHFRYDHQFLMSLKNRFIPSVRLDVIVVKAQKHFYERP